MNKKKRTKIDNTRSFRKSGKSKVSERRERITSRIDEISPPRLCIVTVVTEGLFNKSIFP